MKVVIPGGTGQVGTVLARYFQAAGHHVVVLSRQPNVRPWQVVLWNGRTPGPWVQELEGADVCINLAGRSVDCRYGPRNRKLILESRIDSTRALNRAFLEAHHPPRLWINASTATIYRHALDRPMDEATGELGGSEPGAPDTWNFSIDVAKSWERAFFETELPATRKVAIRSAMTFSPDRGGVFDVLLRFVRWGFGGAHGPGTQFVSWIHDTDFIRAIDFLIARDDIDGVVNLASPNPLPNRDFLRHLREAWGARLGLPAPTWLLEIGTFLMRTESELVLKSRQVIPTRLLHEGFSFTYPHWPAAARDLIFRRDLRLSKS